ncbi:MAG TPA: lysylphosphatidylglycerol synthase transmembrane domain-containing protein [Polyangiaceae bacterium]|nr:lysylphosphatidylglycerol synthase transmembrane domain-containing protein [Polyangiaceae bacterium]
MSSPLPSDAPAKAPRTRLRSAGAKLVASLLIAAGFIWVFQRGGLPIVPDRDALSLVSPWSVVAYFVFVALATALRPYRWIYLLRPIAPGISRARVFAIGLVGFTAIFFAPLRMGEIVRPWLLAEDGEVTFFQATGTVAAERIIDGLVLTLFLIASLVLSDPLPQLPDHLGQLALPVGAVPEAAYLSAAMFAGALISMAVFYRWRALARRLVHVTVGLVSVKLADWMSLRVERLSDGFKFLPSRNAGAFVRDSVLYWVFTLSATWALLRGAGVSATFAEAGVILGVMGIGTLIPSGPGFFGTYQLAVYLGLAMFFPESTVFGAGAVFAFVSYCVHLTLTAASGLIGVVILARTKPHALEAPAVSAGTRSRP